MGQQQANVRVLSAEVTITTSFLDADPMGIIYHGNYFRYFEEARRVMMEKIHYSYLDMVESGYLWPIIDTRVRYIRSVLFNHNIRVTATLTEWENRIRVDYVIYDADSGERMTKAHTMQVAVRMEDKEMLLASPRVFLDKLEAFQYGTD
ncbi:MAG: acyl-CoA thioesterase, partial [Shewanella sp.]|nr:acyl-CoA thioesterase [Shewanella sp.]MCF1431112.1 acyl-CoA thioesterase [Shewanella sp.]MCF1438367.1 acyl-CoA thioesterase [Shewanella sp.]MCF1458680.1 acyl-CoA thioesterase [Shewanella sp.]